MKLRTNKLSEDKKNKKPKVVSSYEDSDPLELKSIFDKFNTPEGRSKLKRKPEKNFMNVKSRFESPVRESLFMKVANTLLEEKESITKENKKGKMVAFYIPQEIGNSLQSMFQDVPGERVEPEDMHITLGLIRSEEDDQDKRIYNAVKQVSQYIDPFDLQIEKFGSFPPNENNKMKHVLYAKPKEEQLHKIHDLLFSLLDKQGIEIDNGSFDFSPHITIKYCDEQPNFDKQVTDPVFRVKEMSFTSRGNKYNAQLNAEGGLKRKRKKKE